MRKLLLELAPLMLAALGAGAVWVRWGGKISRLWKGEKRR